MVDNHTGRGRLQTNNVSGARIVARIRTITAIERVGTIDSIPGRNRRPIVSYFADAQTGYEITIEIPGIPNSTASD